MWKVYLFAASTIIFLVLSIDSFITHNYWHGVGYLLSFLIGGFVSIGTYSDQKK